MGSAPLGSLRAQPPASSRRPRRPIRSLMASPRRLTETTVTDSADATEMDIKVVAVTEMAKAEWTLKLKITKR